MLQGGRHVTLLTAESDRSFDEIEQRLRTGIREAFGCDSSGDQRFYIYETFPTYVIARANGGDGGLYQIPYTMDGDTPTFGEAKEVETAYVPVAEACAFVTTEAEAGNDEGVYPIVALKAGSTLR